MHRPPPHHHPLARLKRGDYRPLITTKNPGLPSNAQLRSTLCESSKKKKEKKKKGKATQPLYDEITPATNVIAMQMNKFLCAGTMFYSPL